MAKKVFIENLGKVIEFPDWMADDQMKAALKDSGLLDMSHNARMARADKHYPEQGFTGSTHNIKAFDASIANPESDWGKGVYISNAIDDVNINYAGEGADLTSRIELRAEQLENWDELEPDEALRIARQELIGDASGGVVYPVRYNADEFVTIDGDNSTKLYQEDYDDLARSEIDAEDYADEWEYEDAVQERTYELQDEDPSSLANKVYEALQQSDIPEADLPKVMDHIIEDMLEGELSLSVIDEAIRGNVLDAYDDAGELLAGGALSSQVFQNLGYKGVIDKTVNRKFGSARGAGQIMEGMDEDTVHTIIFPGNENLIRSEYAKFDPKNKHLRDITAGVGGAGIGYEALSGNPVSADTLRNPMPLTRYEPESKAIGIPDDWRGDVHALGTFLQQNLATV